MYNKIFYHQIILKRNERVSGKCTRKTTTKKVVENNAQTNNICPLQNPLYIDFLCLSIHMLHVILCYNLCLCMSLSVSLCICLSVQAIL